jgi:hypothetical protein
MDFQFYRSSDHWFQELSSKRKTLWSRVLCALQIEASTETLEPNKKKSGTLFWDEGDERRQSVPTWCRKHRIQSRYRYI